MTEDNREWAIAMSSELFGSETFDGYDSEGEALEAAERIKAKCKDNHPEVERDFELGWMDEDRKFHPVRSLPPYEPSESEAISVGEVTILGSVELHPLDDSDFVDPVHVVVEYNNVGIFLRFEGYGELGAAEGCGQPVMIEIHQGHPRVIVWDDINQEDPSHLISLEGAHESCRKELE